MTRSVTLPGKVCFANDAPLVFIAGLNVLEDSGLVFEVAAELKHQAELQRVGLVFKASFDKANRSRYSSPRGPGILEGLAMLAAVKSRFNLNLITDVHDVSQVSAVAEVVDILQIPAFLVRQTDLLAAASGSGRPVLLKKMQMMAPHEMSWAVEKCKATGAKEVMVCERGTTFGYGQLVLDPLSFPMLKSLDVPVVFDVTHALQCPGAGEGGTDGRGAFVESLAAVGVSQGIASLFVECHPKPAQAQCDGHCALPLHRFSSLVRRMMALDAWAKAEMESVDVRP